ncbi:histidine ammonia-lyase [Alkalibacillus salilacus]|uniref:Histidine ammonia-lyase n=1 Tax=Alkalibacillus salilacus TaxID=284582 RepID=A0ABT9VAU6_9BACI|nr:histidine ammonia-lyase [Alkalibacillus salilacus]MDQ0158081.1 histidine ammonia-lyase [Alkalibacillus salilacus]
MTIELKGYDLTLDDIERIVQNAEPVAISSDAYTRLMKSRAHVEEALAGHQKLYGINTGFGKFSDVEIDETDLDDLQKHLIYSHACGVGEPFSKSVSRTMVLLRANALLKGYSGVRPVVVETLCQLLNKQITPAIPSQGSLGASGDLAPLAHLALVLLGDGEVLTDDGHKSAKQVLAQYDIQPIKLQAKEGLALINGTQAMTAVGVQTYLQAEQLLKQSEQIAAMTIEGLEAIIDAFDERIHVARGYNEQTAVARRMRDLLIDSQLTTSQGEKRVQDAYTIRCLPQVHGASWQTIEYVRDKLDIEINAATDNPLIFENGDVVSGGNFHGQPIAIAMDLLKIGVSEIANIAERRIERLVNPQLNDLPPFLSPEPGLQSGAMIMQYTAASLVSENKTLAHPASVDSIPSSANQEDHVSMGTIAARHAQQITHNVQRVLAIELICAMEAVEVKGVNRMAQKTRQLFDEAREVVPSITEDRPFSYDIEALTTWLMDDSKRKEVI